MIKDSLRFGTELEKINEWWFTNSVKEARLYPLKREQFEIVKQELQTSRISTIIGPRRVGKSILLKQTIEHLIQNGENSKYTLLLLVLENVIGINLFLFCKRSDMKLYYWRVNGEVDFVISDRDVIPVEVKYKNQISENDKGNLKNFVRKFNKDKAFLVTKDLYGQERIGKGLLYFIPAEIFLLSL